MMKSIYIGNDEVKTTQNDDDHVYIVNTHTIKLDDRNLPIVRFGTIPQQRHLEGYIFIVH